MNKRHYRQAPGTRRVRLITYKTVQQVIGQCEPPYVRFGDVVSETRRKLGWSQQVLADKLGYSRGSIANIENGRQRVLLTDFIDFAKVLRLDPRKMFATVIQG